MKKFPYAASRPQSNPYVTNKQASASSDSGTWEEQLRTYGAMDNDRLMKTMLQVAAQSRADGSLDNASLDAFAANVAPMLDANARARMQELVAMLKSQGETSEH